MLTVLIPEQELPQLISRLNHKITGNLARLEGLYLLYKEEGSLREELWEQAFHPAKLEVRRLLTQSFTLYQPLQNGSLQLA